MTMPYVFMIAVAVFFCVSVYFVTRKKETPIWVYFVLFLLVSGSFFGVFISEIHQNEQLIETTEQ